MAEKAINKILKQQERKLNETGSGSKARTCPSPSKLLAGSRLSSAIKIKKQVLHQRLAGLKKPELIWGSNLKKLEPYLGLNLKAWAQLGAHLNPIRVPPLIRNSYLEQKWAFVEKIMDTKGVQAKNTQERKSDGMRESFRLGLKSIKTLNLGRPIDTRPVW